MTKSTIKPVASDWDLPQKEWQFFKWKAEFHRFLSLDEFTYNISCISIFPWFISFISFATLFQEIQKINLGNMQAIDINNMLKDFTPKNQEQAFDIIGQTVFPKWKLLH